MRIGVLAFLLGDISLLFFSTLPSIYYIWLSLVIAGIALVFFKTTFLRYVFIALLGLAWGLWYAHSQLALQLPSTIETKTITVRGSVASIPDSKDSHVRFEFLIQQPFTMHVRLNWYTTQKIAVGEQWQLTVRLKKPRGFWNVGSFDYEAWLFAQHILATGYVVESPQNQLLKNDPLNHLTDRLRTKFATIVTQTLQDKPYVGLINALTVGVRSDITESQWQVMRGTGTNHLFAIAGLHIGFVSGMVWALMRLLWRRTGRLMLYISVPEAAAFAALIAAIIYSALAGFALPTQRAILMLSVFLLTSLLRQTLPAWTAWSLALFAILLVDPLVILSDSFWLSFGAVAYIIYGISARRSSGVWWQQWARTQWIVALGLIPLTLLFFHQTSLAGFIANAFAIPWVGFVVLPLCLSGSFISLIFPTLGHWLIGWSEQTIAWLWPLLEHIAQWEHVQWYAYLNNPWVLFSACIGMVLLLAPRGFPARWLGMVWLLPLLIWKPAGPAQSGEIWFTLLDVGQGLAAVVRTQHHTLIYDTGPKFSEHFDTGSAVIVPFLKYHQIKVIDKLIISHPDNDHIGGAHSLLEQSIVRQVLTSEPEKLPQASRCIAGQHWQWDGVNFDILYPPENLYGLDNDSSCVLRIDNGQKSILLVGDIEKRSEAYLVKNVANLSSTILVVPHHGSKTSSTWAFVQAVHPQYALFPVGYLNKFGFPKAEVVQRYVAIGAKIFTTVDEGAIEFKLGLDQPVWMDSYKKRYGRFWMY